MGIDNVEDLGARVQYVASAAQTDFDYPFAIFTDADLVVDIDGTTKALSTDYTVSGAGDDTGGTVTLLSAATGGEIVTIYRDIAIERLTDIQQNGPWSSTAYNDEQDKTYLLLQQLDSRCDRSLRIPFTAEVADADIELTVANWANKYLTFDSNGKPTPAVLSDAAMTQATIGNLLFPRSAAEIAANATPTDYSSTYVDVTRLGVVGDNSTDNTTAVQSILDAAAIGYSHIHFPSQNRNGQTIYICGKVSVYEGTRVTADPGVIIRSNITSANDHVFECISTLGSATALTGDAAVRATSVDVTSASGLSAGMIVLVRDATYKYGTTGRNMELNEIASVASLTVTLKNRLIGSYATGSSAELVPVTAPARNIKFENVYVDIPSGKDGGAFYFEEAYNCEVNNCRSTGQKGQPGVQTWRSAYIKVNGGDFSDGQSQSTPGYGYGCNFGEASHHCVARGTSFKNVRECAIGGNARYCGYVNCISVSSYDNAFNTHAMGAEDCYFEGCKSYSARSKGFYAGGVTGQAPDKRIRFDNCESYYSGYFGFWSQGDTGVEPEDITFEHCRAFHYGDDTATSYGFYVLKNTRPRVIGCYINADGETNARAAIKVEICTDAIVRHNTICGSSSGWGIIHAGCTGVTIEDNSISGIGGSAQGVYAESTHSTKVLVRRNSVDNDTPFTKNTGDIHEYNEYDTLRQNARGAAAATTDGATITHGCVTTPYMVRATGSVASQFVSVTTIGGTTFTVAIKKDTGAAGDSQTVYWEADS